MVLISPISISFPIKPVDRHFTLPIAVLLPISNVTVSILSKYKFPFAILCPFSITFFSSKILENIYSTVHSASFSIILLTSTRMHQDIFLQNIVINSFFL